MGGSGGSGASAPFIMPDGSRFASFIRADDPVVRSKRSRRVPASGQRLDAAWLGSREDAAAAIDVLDKIGRRRANRWLNNRLLVAMAGRLTAADMEDLFKPVPFGAKPHPTAWEQLTEPENAMLCELLRSISMEEESRYLRYLSSGASGERAPRTARARAELAWKSVPRRGRAALWEAGAAELVAELEDRILAHDFAEEVGVGDF